MNKKITLLLLGLFAVVYNAKSANAFSSPFNLDNESFTLNNANLGAADATGNSAINTTANPNGFGSQFDTSGTFLLLGANDPNQGIDSGSNANENSSNVSATAPINIDSNNISAGEINFQFDYSFQGNDTFNQDSFLVALIGGSSTFEQIVSEGTYGNSSFNGNVDISTLTPGNYDLFVSLNESTAPGNSAVGFDNFVVSEVGTAPPPAEVPFGAAPNTGIFILGSLYAGSSYLKRRKTSS